MLHAHILQTKPALTVPGVFVALLSDPSSTAWQAGILHALVPTEAPYLRMLEHYEPAEHVPMQI